MFGMRSFAPMIGFALGAWTNSVYVDLTGNSTVSKFLVKFSRRVYKTDRRKLCAIDQFSRFDRTPINLRQTDRQTHRHTHTHTHTHTDTEA